MTLLKRKAQLIVNPIELKADDRQGVSLVDFVLELSIMVGYIVGDIHANEIRNLDLLIREHCVSRLVAMERGNLQSHLHFQMVVRARIASTHTFGILVQKYMNWFDKKIMDHVGKMTYKVLSNRLLHTYKGMIGYYLKDTKKDHFAHAMFKKFDANVIVGKTLHAIYGRADLKSRVTLK